METLNEYKRKLAKQLDSKEKYLKDIELKEVQLANIDKEKKAIGDLITSIGKKNDKLNLQKSKMDDNKNLKMKINNFIKDKETEAELKYQIKNLKRKIEVLEPKYMKVVQAQTR